MTFQVNVKTKTGAMIWRQWDSPDQFFNVYPATYAGQKHWSTGVMVTAERQHIPGRTSAYDRIIYRVYVTDGHWAYTPSDVIDYGKAHLLVEIVDDPEHGRAIDLEPGVNSVANTQIVRLSDEAVEIMRGIDSVIDAEQYDLVGAQVDMLASFSLMQTGVQTPTRRPASAVIPPLHDAVSLSARVVKDLDEYRHDTHESNKLCTCGACRAKRKAGALHKALVRLQAHVKNLASKS